MPAWGILEPCLLKKEIITTSNTSRPWLVRQAPDPGAQARRFLFSIEQPPHKKARYPPASGSDGHPPTPLTPSRPPCKTPGRHHQPYRGRMPHNQSTTTMHIEPGFFTRQLTPPAASLRASGLATEATAAASMHDRTHRRRCRSEILSCSGPYRHPGRCRICKAQPFSTSTPPGPSMVPEAALPPYSAIAAARQRRSSSGIAASIRNQRSFFFLIRSRSRYPLPR